MSVVWTAPSTPNAAALERMRQRLPRPAGVPPVAWFMGEEQGYLVELQKPTSELSSSTLSHALFELASGTNSFPGTEHIAAWKAWLLALLPDLTLRLDVHGDAVVAVLVVLGDDLDLVYPGFRADVLDTLGRGALAPEFWSNGDVTRDLHPWLGSPLSAVLASDVLLHLRHLRADEFDPWVGSVVKLGGAGWRAHWLLLLSALLPSLVGRDPGRVLDAPTLPTDAFLLAGHPLGSREALVASLRRHFTPDLLAAWSGEMRQQIVCSARIPGGTDVSALFSARADEVFDALT